MKGLVADANIQGQVEHLVQRMQADAWGDFWQALGLALYPFEDVGLSQSSTDLEVWDVCQAEQLAVRRESSTSLPHCWTGLRECLVSGKSKRPGRTMFVLPRFRRSHTWSGGNLEAVQ